jgi:hypothetical protein
MSDDPVVSKSEEIIKKVNELVEQAEGRIRETDDLYASIGLERGHLQNFLKSDKFTPEQKKQAREQQQQWQQELDQEIEAAVAREGGSSSTGKTAKMSMKRNILRI